MTWVSEQMKKGILELAKLSGINQYGGFAMYEGKQYYINVDKGIVDPIIQHGDIVDNQFEKQKKHYINVLEAFFGGK